MRSAHSFDLLHRQSKYHQSPFSSSVMTTHSTHSLDPKLQSCSLLPHLQLLHDASHLPNPILGWWLQSLSNQASYRRWQHLSGQPHLSTFTPHHHHFHLPHPLMPSPSSSGCSSSQVNTPHCVVQSVCLHFFSGVRWWAWSLICFTSYFKHESLRIEKQDIIRFIAFIHYFH